MARTTRASARRTPERTCVACRERRGKRELVRVVRVEGDVVVDESGKLHGRGAYLCRRRACCADPGLASRLGRALKTTLTKADEERLAAYAAELPEDGEGG